jgi:hypothetical protein
LDSTPAATSADSWVPGFGYSSPNLFAVFALPEGKWSPIYTGDLGAVIAKVTEKDFLPDSAIAEQAEKALAQNGNYRTSTLFQDWIANLPKSAKVENKLDLVFRD